MKMQKIITNIAILGGRPVLGGTRILVSSVLDQLKNGHGTGKHVKEMYPQLTEGQIDDAIEFANQNLNAKFGS